jgi:transposase
MGVWDNDFLDFVEGRNDARALAQILGTGGYRQVHVKSQQCRLWRALPVARRTVLNEMQTRKRGVVTPAR